MSFLFGGVNFITFYIFENEIFVLEYFSSLVSSSSFSPFLLFFSSSSPLALCPPWLPFPITPFSSHCHLLLFLLLCLPPLPSSLHHWVLDFLDQCVQGLQVGTPGKESGASTEHALFPPVFTTHRLPPYLLSQWQAIKGNWTAWFLGQYHLLYSREVPWVLKGFYFQFCAISGPCPVLPWETSGRSVTSWQLGLLESSGAETL